MNKILIISTFIGLISLIVMFFGLIIEHNQVVNLSGCSFLVSLIGTFTIILIELKKQPFKMR